jgi:hypothetical protein
MSHAPAAHLSKHSLLHMLHEIRKSGSSRSGWPLSSKSRNDSAFRPPTVPCREFVEVWNPLWYFVTWGLTWTWPNPKLGEPLENIGTCTEWLQSRFGLVVANTHTNTYDYSLQITITHRLVVLAMVFNALLDSGYQRRTFSFLEFRNRSGASAIENTTTLLKYLTKTLSMQLILSDNHYFSTSARAAQKSPQ